MVLAQPFPRRTGCRLSQKARQSVSPVLLDPGKGTRRDTGRRVPKHFLRGCLKSLIQYVPAVPLSSRKGIRQAAGPPYAQKSPARRGLAKPDRGGQEIFSCAGLRPAQLPRGESLARSLLRQPPFAKQVLAKGLWRQPRPLCKKFYAAPVSQRHLAQQWLKLITSPGSRPWTPAFSFAPGICSC
jgi:hypothetical protein